MIIFTFAIITLIDNKRAYNHSEKLPFGQSGVIRLLPDFPVSGSVPRRSGVAKGVFPPGAGTADTAYSTPQAVRTTIYSTVRKNRPEPWGDPLLTETGSVGFTDVNAGSIVDKKDR